MKKITSLFVTLLLIVGLAATSASAQTAASAPKSVIHIITVAWKEGTTEAQIKAALDGAHKLPSQYKGITRVWTKTVKIQNPPGTTVNRSNVIVMEFADEKALADYTNSPAQLEWYKVYTNIRNESTTHDVTN